MKDFNCVNDCPDLGACCKNFLLEIEGEVLGSREHEHDKDYVNELLRKKGLPFFAHIYNKERRFWLLICLNLEKNGMCSAYESRPMLCRNFQPKSGKGCVAQKDFLEILHVLYAPVVSFFKQFLKLKGPA